MGVKGICKFLSHRLFEAVIVIILLVFMPNLPPYTSISESFKVAPAIPLEGKLSLNEKLGNAEIWHKGDLIGPEGFADYNGELYASLATGEIVKLVGNHVTPIVQLGKPCKGSHEERICGRPLGLQFDGDGNLYAADAYYGIFKVDVKTGQKEQLVSPNEEIEGKRPKLFNSLTVASNGDIFWSSSSSEFSLEDGAFDIFVDGSGRLLHYNSKTKKNRVLIDKLHFANGVALSDDEEFVIVVETVLNRIHRYYLKGTKEGTKDIFIDGLPGFPDNIKSVGSDGFLVPLLMPRDDSHPSLIHIFGPFPWIRKLFARIMGLTELAFNYANKTYPNEFSEKAVHFIGHFTSFNILTPHYRTTVLRISKSGEIVDALHTTTGKISDICEAHIFKGILYLGSPYNDYIARIPLDKIGWDRLQPQRVKRDVPVEATTTARPTKTTVKPTTTTAPNATPATPRQTVPPTQTQKQTPPVQEKQAPPPQKPAPKTTQALPTEKPTQATPKPTQAPTTTPKPTQAPTQKPAQVPTPKPTQAPTQKPAQAPTPKPTQAPTQKPAQAPTPKPTQAPTEKPAQVPTTKPTQAPVAEPARVPPKASEAPLPAATQVPPTQETIQVEPTLGQKQGATKQEPVKKQESAVPKQNNAN